MKREITSSTTTIHLKKISQNDHNGTFKRNDPEIKISYILSGKSSALLQWYHFDSSRSQIAWKPWHKTPSYHFLTDYLFPKCSRQTCLVSGVKFPSRMGNLSMPGCLLKNKIMMHPPSLSFYFPPSLRPSIPPSLHHPGILLSSPPLSPFFPCSIRNWIYISSVICLFYFDIMIKENYFI